MFAPIPSGGTPALASPTIVGPAGPHFVCFRSFLGALPLSVCGDLRLQDGMLVFNIRFLSPGISATIPGVPFLQPPHSLPAGPAAGAIRTSGRG